MWIIGVVIGVFAGLGIGYLLFKRFVFDKYIYPKIKVRGHKKFVERVRKKEQAAEQEQQEKVASEQAQENRERDDENTKLILEWISAKKLTSKLLVTFIQHSKSYVKSENELSSIWTNQHYWRQKQAYEELIKEIK